MKTPKLLHLLIASLLGAETWALEMAPKAFTASREMVCVLAQESLGELSEDEYGERMGDVLKGFDSDERDDILAKALGYYDGLMFSIAEDDTEGVNARLHYYISNGPCEGSGNTHTVRL